MITTKKIPTFTRKDVALLLQCTRLTVANREESGRYPPPKRDDNNNRYYHVNDVFELMHITHKQVYLGPIVAVLHDKGYTDVADLNDYLTEEFRVFQDKITGASDDAVKQVAKDVGTDGQTASNDK